MRRGVSFHTYILVIYVWSDTTVLLFVLTEVFDMKRHAMSRSGSRSNFSHHASHMHRKNQPRPIMRGGIRL
ncbi:hypothetical protein [Blackfly microvirus SF02]|uniref:Uncharacterized protein n=1 Tax=Blackfly microvirus SF02 TaxID=2576452 RepID=A0A4P8PT82_9VIRU|nr:hypothetical protein [Blackfly microvirus SF02]